MSSRYCYVDHREGYAAGRMCNKIHIPTADTPYASAPAALASVGPSAHATLKASESAWVNSLPNSPDSWVRNSAQERTLAYADALARVIEPATMHELTQTQIANASAQMSAGNVFYPDGNPFFAESPAEEPAETAGQRRRFSLVGRR